MCSWGGQLALLFAVAQALSLAQTGNIREYIRLESRAVAVETPAPCGYTLGIIHNFPWLGGTKPVTLTGGGCSWSAALNSPSWLSASPGSGSGSATINLSAPYNWDYSGPSTGSMGIAGQVIRFTRASPGGIPVAYRFDDVPWNDWNSTLYYDNGDYGFSNYIALGRKTSVILGTSVSPPLFAPEIALSREAMAAMVIRAKLWQAGDYELSPGQGCLHGWPKGAGNDCGFDWPAAACYTDVPNDWSFPYVQKLCALEIADVSSGPFGYGQTATRVQMAELLIKAMFGKTFFYPTTAFFPDDVPATHPKFAFVQKLREQGITSGTGTTTYNPSGSLLRYQMAVFTIRAFFTPLP